MIEPGSVVIVYLSEPRERIWGVLQRLDGAGVMVEGFDVEGFDAWLSRLDGGCSPRETMSVIFFPMIRVGRILLDRGSDGVPSFAERFEQRIGRSINECLDGQPGEQP